MYNLNLYLSAETQKLNPVNTNHFFNIYAMLNQQQRYWADIL